MQLSKVKSRKSVRGECRDKIYFGYAEPKPDFMSEANKVKSRKSVRGECRDKIYFGYAEPKPDFMSEANKVESRDARLVRPWFCDSTTKISSSERRGKFT